MKHRSIEPEVMDDPALDAGRHRRALRGLGRLNRLSGSPRLIWSAIQRFIPPQAGHESSKVRGQIENRQSKIENPPPPLRVLDIATGGGDLPIALHRLAVQGEGIGGGGIQIDGCDLSPVALDYARGRAEGVRAVPRFFYLDALNDPLPGDYDVLLCSLFLHHLSDAQAERLLRRMAEAARVGVVVNDLRRSRANLALVHLAARLVSRSDVVHTDGPRSVRAAFTLPEARELAERAGLRGAVVKSAFPCRYLLTWRKP